MDIQTLLSLGFLYPNCAVSSIPMITTTTCRWLPHLHINPLYACNFLWPSLLDTINTLKFKIPRTKLIILFLRINSYIWLPCLVIVLQYTSRFKILEPALSFSLSLSFYMQSTARSLSFKFYKVSNIHPLVSTAITTTRVCALLNSCQDYSFVL